MQAQVTPFECGSKAEELVSEFCCSTSLKRPQSSTFDPLSECVAALQKKRKKRSKPKSRMITVNFACLKKTLSVPHRELKLTSEGRVKKVEVRAVILSAFEDLEVPARFTYLCVGQGSVLECAPNKEPDGTSVIEQVGRSSLYICQVFTPKVGWISVASVRYSSAVPFR